MHAPSLRLDQLVHELNTPASVRGDASVRISGVQQDSRRVLPGDVFVARPGARSDGTQFVQTALNLGAVAVMTDVATADKLQLQVPVIAVDDLRMALAYGAAAAYGHPGFSLDVIGVTGTNGKTTTTHLIRSALDRLAGRPVCATLGTVGHMLGDELLPAAHTTPEADEIARVLRTWRQRGAEAVAMEVSSHALSLGRVLAVRFRVAAFTNLTHDHLDFHGDLASYAAAKARLFTECAPGTAVINVGSEVGARIAEQVRARLLRVATRPTPGADLVARDVRIGLDGTRFWLDTPSGTHEMHTHLVGIHNVENLLVTLGVLLQLDMPLGPALQAVQQAQSAPGRLERCDGAADDVVVLVDYAHTPDALERVLEAAQRAIEPGARTAAEQGRPAPRVWCVFGCGGDRDAEKRGPMGHAVAAFAQVALVTNDNPRSERPEAIAEPIVLALRAARFDALAPDELSQAAQGYLVELDRARAIELAVRSARAGDVVLIAGKGHEATQTLGASTVPFDDRAHARAALQRRREERG